MTREEHIENLKAIASDMPSDKCSDWIESLMAGVKALEALEQQPCEDTISRQAALNSLIDNTHLDGYDLAEALDAIENKEKLPPVIPQPKMGHWIYTGDYITDGMLKCSECGFEHDVSEMFSYCPNCGAKMQEVEE